MANVLTVPNSGIISFDNRAFSISNLSVPPLSTSARIGYGNTGDINITSYTTAATALDRFTVDGTQGRLFSVTDSLTGTLFSVNNITGLPILEVRDRDTVIAGKFNTNALVVSGAQVSIGNTPFNTSKLGVSGNVTVVGDISGTGVVYAQQLNVTGNVSVSGELTSRIPLASTSQATYTLRLSDDSTLLFFDSSSSITVIVPNDSVVNFRRGSVVGVTRYGTGLVEISGAAGVTVNSTESMRRLREQYSTGTLVKRTNNNWLLFGDIDI